MCVYDCVVLQSQVYSEPPHIYLWALWQCVSGMMDDVFISGQSSEVVVWVQGLKKQDYF